MTAEIYHSILKRPKSQNEGIGDGESRRRRPCFGRDKKS